MIFGYTFEEAKKAVGSAVILGLAALALFVTYDPGLDAAFITLVGAAFAVVQVFMSPYSPTDLSKAVSQLQGSVATLLGFWITIDPGFWIKVSSVIAAGIATYTVFKLRNEPAPAAH